MLPPNYVSENIFLGLTFCLACGLSRERFCPFVSLYAQAENNDGLVGIFVEPEPLFFSRLLIRRRRIFMMTPTMAGWKEVPAPSHSVSCGSKVDAEAGFTRPLLLALALCSLSPLV